MTRTVPIRLDVHLTPDDTARDLRADVRAGLTATPRTLPPKWFYDERGSELFERITALPEYYPTRAEREILAARAVEFAAASRATTLVELGSGSSEKTRLLLDALRSNTAVGGTLRRFVPFDVSEAFLAQSAAAVAAEYPGLDVHGVVGDFTRHLDRLPLRDPGEPDDDAATGADRSASGGASHGANHGDGSGDVAAGERVAVAFLGGTIGNLVPAERAPFLRSLRAALRPGDVLLLGTDLVKDPAVLVPAYDDAQGVTAEFNRNVLHVLARELGADVDPTAFEHVALWDAEHEWIEMRLRAVRPTRVRIAALGLDADFAEGDELRTEVSAKFRRDGVTAELAAAGFTLRDWWTDDEDRFALSVALAA